MTDILFCNSNPTAKTYYEKFSQGISADCNLITADPNFIENAKWQEAIIKKEFDLILCAFHDNLSEHQILSWLKTSAPGTPCLAVGYSRDYHMARAAYLAGADDYLQCNDLLNMNLDSVLAETNEKLITRKSHALLFDTKIISVNARNDKTPDEEHPTCTGEQSTIAESAMIQKAKAYILQHFMDHTLSLGSVSRHVSLSEKHFSMLFSKACHTTFSEFVMHCRMEKAKELLLQSDQKIYQIALQVGYSSVEHFSRYFKKYEGLSPESFRA